MSKNSKQCQAPGCHNEGMKSVVPAWLTDEKDEIYYYCDDHIVENGFCRGCGIYSAGTDCFDFGRYAGLCGTCGDAARYEDRREEEDQEYWELSPWEEQDEEQYWGPEPWEINHQSAE